MDYDFNRAYDEQQSQMFGQNQGYQDPQYYNKRVSPYQVLLAYIYFYLTDNGMHEAANMLLTETKHNNSFFNSIKNDFDFNNSLTGSGEPLLLEWWDLLWSSHSGINPNLNQVLNNPQMGPPAQRVQDLRKPQPSGQMSASPAMQAPVQPVSLPSQPMQNVMYNQMNTTPMPHGSPPVQAMPNPNMVTPMMGNAVPTQYRRMSMQSSKGPRNKVSTMPNTPMSQPASAPTPASAPVDFMNMMSAQSVSSNPEMDPMFIDASWFTS